ncbi:MAG TPA: hypothetical protein VFV54_05770, partial [Thermoanaerobaculia bacterium]|nr:hypothetical protein [Thermoanaerobaculia bacterium]
MSRPVMVLLLAVALSALTAEPCPAQAQAPFTERSFVTAIDLVAQVLDSEGETPADLRPSDFRLLENGVEQRIIGIEYLDPTADPIEPAQAGAVTVQRRPEWQVVIWIDAITTSGPTLTFTARELLKRVPELLKFGRVTLVYSDFSADVLVAATRDEAELTRALNALLKRPGGDRVTRVRREFLSALDSVRQMKRKKIEEDGNRLEGPDYITMGIVDSDVPGYIAEEERLIGISRVNLLSALERMPRKLPRMLIYVGDGFDLVPAEFYVRTLETSGASFVDPMKLRTELSKEAERDTRELTHRLAVGGWTAVTIGGTTMIAEDATRRTGMRKFDKRSGTAPTFTFLNPADPLIAMAEETGGERVAHAAGLPKALAALGRRIRVTYQVDREPDAEPRKVELVALRPGLTVRAPGWSSSTTVEAVAEGRAIEALRDEADAFDIPIGAQMLPPREGSPLPTLEVRADFSPARTSFANIGATKLRFTIAIQTSGEKFSIVHQIATVENLAALRAFVWKSPMKMPENVSAIAVVAEELITGLWGSTRFAPGDLQRTEAAAAARVSAAPPAEALAPWDVDEAFARAAAERKLVVAFETNDGWEGCELDCGLLENRATSHPEIRRLLSPFIAVESPQTALPPRIAIYDPSRRLLLSWSAAFSSVNDRRRPFSTGELAEMLRRATEAAPNALRAHDLASAGQLREAQMALGTAFRAARQVDRAEAAW